MKVNDYVRTDKGTIFKVENITEIDIDGQWFKSKAKENSVIKDLPRFMYDETDEYIIKSSPNIIDLIEIGDIITFKDDYVVYNVIALPNEEVGLDVFYLAKHYDGETEDIEISKKLMQKYINSIVTREQFERCEYKI